jgi:hypothetical protein
MKVPDHIPRPDYIGKLIIIKKGVKNPVFGIYSGNPVVHNKEM